ncbi:MAG: HAD-IIB family hydrolase [Desulfobacterales bacterium]|nr:HAD-IIB family hydrolase [Desulfobacterales bacterium]
MKQIVIFTDLDGTLIDHDTYDFKEAQPALDQLRSRSIPVVICSSKTRAEIELYRRRMGLDDPFIVENGGAIFIPGHGLDLRDVNFVEKGPYHVVELGVPYTDLRVIWREIAKKNFRMKGFGEMTIEEIAACTGLPFEEAPLAAKREYSEPFIFSDTSAQFRVLESLLKKKGLRITRGGRFYHMIGQNDKGKAVRILTRVYANTYPDKQVWTAGLGDSANDVPMLRHVDMPVVIRKKTGQWERIHGIYPIVYSDIAGPGGWADVIHTILA